MTEKIVSPNVFINENDKSIITQGPVVVGAAIIGPTVHGQPLIPTTVTSYSQFASIYGESFVSGGYSYEYFTSLAAKEYFDNGGKTLLVTKIISGSANVNVYASSSIPASTGSIPAFSLEALAWGDISNSSGSENSNGALANGTQDNVRWEVIAKDPVEGTFDVVIRRGDDNTSDKNILETWSDLSLDPQLPNYISRVIGDQKPQFVIDADGTGYIRNAGNYPINSRYVNVKSVGIIPNSIDNEGNFKPANSGSLPLVASGSFGGGVPQTNLIPNFFEKSGVAGDGNIQGVNPADYVTALTLLTNKEEFRFNVLLVPGINLTSAGISNSLSVAQLRGDAIVIVDATNFGSSVGATVTAAASQNSNYGAAYYPWTSIYASNLGKTVWVPPSVVMGGVYAFNDSVAQPWNAPAGFTRGGIPSVVECERKLSQDDRDRLYKVGINPLATFPGDGVVAWGQKTLQKKPTSLDRVNVRRLLIKLKDFIGGEARKLIFEQNTTVTRNKFINKVNPYLETVVSQNGLYAFKVTMDGTNNTSDVIDRNQLVGTIQIQPTRTAEFIILDFTLTPTGATFQ